MRLGRSWQQFIKYTGDSPLAVALAVFIIAFVVGIYLQLHGSFADPDSFYHARMATLIRDQGLITDFRWLPFTVLSDNYINQHFLYHVLLIPFISVSGPLVGIKLATIFITAVMSTVFYGLLRSFQVRGSFIYTMLLLFVNPFMFRIGLAKAPGLAITLTLIGLWLIFHYRYKWLFWFAWFYVWVYGGFAVLLITATTAAIVGAVRKWIIKRQRHRSFLYRITEQLANRRTETTKPRLNLKIFLAAAIGVIAGLIINPTFPSNIIFYYYQLIKIGILNYQNTIGVGGEWYPYAFTELVPATIFVSILVVLGLLAFALQFRKMSMRSWTMLLLTAFFFVLTLKSRRYVEYYVPIGILFGAFAVNDGLSGNVAKAMMADLKVSLKRSWGARVLAVIVIGYLVIGAAGVAIRDLRGVRNDLANGLPYDLYKASATWLKDNAPDNAIIVHSDWDEFPILFYYNTDNRYIAGLDATFLYDHDPDRYWEWVHLTTGELEEHLIYSTVADDLEAEYVFLTKDHMAMDNLISGVAGFSLVYEDSEAKIYQAIR
ncbi:MAG: hypothetical protein V1853_03855 [bacterium]